MFVAGRVGAVVDGVGHCVSSKPDNTSTILQIIDQ
jgi:hypothetical protein